MATETVKEVQLDPVARVGEAAGSIWRHLHDNGSVNLASLPKRLGIPRDLVMQAIGWLAREDKVDIVELRRTKTVSLRC